MSSKPILLARQYRSLILRVAFLFALLWMTMLTSGCNIIAWGAQAFRDDDKPIDVAAQYTGLADKRVAVMVSADDYTLFRFPRSTARVCEVVSIGIANNVPGVAVSLPREISKYQHRNPYWITSQPSRLIDALGVDRLVVIDLNEYRTHDQGNRSVFRGSISATVSVYEADEEDPDNSTFQQQVQAQFPEGSAFGVISDNTEEAQVETAVLKLFTLRAAGLFYDHQEPQRK